MTTEKTLDAEQLLILMIDAVDSDLENGVAWMNDEASAEFAKKYPRMLQAIVAIREHLLERDE